MVAISPAEYETRIRALEKLNATLAAEIDRMRPVVTRAGYWDAVELDPAGWIATETQGLTCGRINPTHWMFLPDPPSVNEVNNGR